MLILQSITGYFNPRSPWGERLLFGNTGVSSAAFQSTLPVGGATRLYGPPGWCRMISIHAPRGGSDDAADPGTVIYIISIHAPRGGSDLAFFFVSLCSINFNPRSPWGERRDDLAGDCRASAFQSTLPVGGATAALVVILITHEFQSTLPVGGATLGQLYYSSPKFISIHAPRGGSDLVVLFLFLRLMYFNPRSPWGERPRRCRMYMCTEVFQSTLPVGGATAMQDVGRYVLAFQSTLPVGGATYI